MKNHLAWKALRIHPKYYDEGIASSQSPLQSRSVGFGTETIINENCDPPTPNSVVGEGTSNDGMDNRAEREDSASKSDLHWPVGLNYALRLFENDRFRVSESYEEWKKYC